MKRRSFLGLLVALPFMAKAKAKIEIVRADCEITQDDVDNVAQWDLPNDYLKETDLAYKGDFNRIRNMSVSELDGMVGVKGRDSFRRANRELSRLRAQAVDDMKFYSGDRWEE